MTLQAIIFDFDGVLVNAEPSHMRAWQGVLQPLQIIISEQEYNSQYIGMGDRDFLEGVLKKHSQNLSVDAKKNLITSKQNTLLSELQHTIDVYPAVPQMLKNLSQKLQLAIVTGSQRREIDLIVDKMGWKKYFQNIVTHNDVAHGKPDPEGFLKAFPKIPKKNQVVVEDSPYGVEAANRAGIACAAITHSYSAQRLNKAQWIVANHEELLKLIESL